MATRKSTRAAQAPDHYHPDATGAQLLALMASLRTQRGSSGLADEDEYQRGRSVIERIAISAGNSDEEAPMRLTAAQCADVLHYLDSCEPIEPRTWWDDPEEGHSHVAGFYRLIRCMEASLRELPQKREARS